MGFVCPENENIYIFYVFSFYVFSFATVLTILVSIFLFSVNEDQRHNGNYLIYNFCFWSFFLHNFLYHDKKWRLRVSVITRKERHGQQQNILSEVQFFFHSTKNDFAVVCVLVEICHYFLSLKVVRRDISRDTESKHLCHSAKKTKYVFGLNLSSPALQRPIKCNYKIVTVY